MHLRVFGCACYPNTSATAPHKLAPRSTRCLFLGYSSDHNGYPCPYLFTHRVIISRHVVFEEDVFPLTGSSPPLDLDSLLDVDPIDIPPLSVSLVPVYYFAPRAAPPLRPPSACFVDSAHVYQRCLWSGPLIPSSNKPLRASYHSHDEPLVHHPVAIHRDPCHVYLMVT